MFGNGFHFFDDTPYPTQRDANGALCRSICSLHNAKRTGGEHKIATVANTTLETLRVQIPLFVLDPLLKVVIPLKWRERITRSAQEVKPPLAMILYLAHVAVA